MEMSYSDRESTSVMSDSHAKRADVSLTKAETALEGPEQLRRKRSVAKGDVTKKIKELTELKLNLRGSGEVKVKVQ